MKKIVTFDELGRLHPGDGIAPVRGDTLYQVGDGREVEIGTVVGVDGDEGQVSFVPSTSPTYRGDRRIILQR